MRKVTTINLNHNAYQIDEDGYDTLRAYLEDAGRSLADNPDRDEILADLEQAIADKCRIALGSYKTVVSAEEIRRILKEMGPVAGGNGESAQSGRGTTGTAPPGAATSDSAASGASGFRMRRLYRIREGQHWAGICTGLAAYAGVEVKLVRLAAILITVFTGFFPGLIIYAGLAFILPIATTPEELSAAHGQPFNAQELVDRAKKKHEDYRSYREERRARRAMRRQSRWWAPPAAPNPPPGYAARVTGGLLLPVLTVISAVWFAAMAIAMLSLWSSHHYGLWVWPNGIFPGDMYMPRWVAAIAIMAIYALLAIPLGASRRAALYYANGGALHGWADAWSGLLWVALVAVLLLVAWHQLPLLQDLLRQVTHSHTTIVSL